MHPIELGNIVLILVGAALVVGALVMLYRTVKGLLHPKPKAERTQFWLPSELLNILIGVVFLIAGVLFIVNNLKGNPLAKTSPAKTGSHLELESQTQTYLASR
jgi:uncharacterized membrane protein YfcA